MKQIFLFTAEWCPSCKILEPTMDKIKSIIPVEKLTLNMKPIELKRPMLQVFPQQYQLKNGEEIRRFYGPRSYEQVLEFIR